MLTPKRLSLLLALLLLALVLLPSSATAQQAVSFPAFALAIQTTKYDALGKVISVSMAHRYDSVNGDWRYSGNFGDNVLETVYRRGVGVFVSDSKVGRLIKLSIAANGCPATSDEQLRKDPSFVRTESVLGYTAYVLRQHILDYSMETFFVPALGRIPFKRIYCFADGHKEVEEPISLTFGEPAAGDVRGPDYPVVDQLPVFTRQLNSQILWKPDAVYPGDARAFGISGTVVVQVIVENGRVISARSITPIPLLGEAAIDAAYQASFSPTFSEGKTVVTTGIISYEFKL